MFHLQEVRAETAYLKLDLLKPWLFEFLHLAQLCSSFHLPSEDTPLQFALVFLYLLHVSFRFIPIISQLFPKALLLESITFLFPLLALNQASHSSHIKAAIFFIYSCSFLFNLSLSIFLFPSQAVPV